jgi:hypothetical protein
MTTFANINPAVAADGVPYALNFPLTGTEGDIFNQGGSDPRPVIYNQATIVVVNMTIAGGPASNSSYVILQTSLDGGTTWVDLAWCLLTATANGLNEFALSAGSSGSNSFQQTRAAGTAPASNGSQQTPLGGLLRLVGQATLSGGTAPSVTVSANMKMLGLR